MRDFRNWQRRSFRFHPEQRIPFDTTVAAVSFDRSFTAVESKIGLERVFNPHSKLARKLSTAALIVDQIEAKPMERYYGQLATYSLAVEALFGQLTYFGSEY